MSADWLPSLAEFDDSICRKVRNLLDQHSIRVQRANQGARILPKLHVGTSHGLRLLSAAIAKGSKTVKEVNMVLAFVNFNPNANTKMLLITKQHP